MGEKNVIKQIMRERKERLWHTADKIGISYSNTFRVNAHEKRQDGRRKKNHWSANFLGLHSVSCSIPISVSRMSSAACVRSHAASSSPSSSSTPASVAPANPTPTTNGVTPKSRPPLLHQSSKSSLFSNLSAKSAKSDSTPNQKDEIDDSNTIRLVHTLERNLINRSINQSSRQFRKYQAIIVNSSISLSKSRLINSGMFRVRRSAM